MQIRRTSNVQNTNAVNLQTQNKAAAPAGGESAPVDQLDFSPEARAVTQTEVHSDIRMDRVNELRAEIQSGAYETSAKLDAAVARMLDELV